MSNLSRILFLAALPFAGYAQSVTDMSNSVALASTDSIVAVTITASQGDGGSCTITKLKSGTIAWTYSCADATAKTTARSAVIRSNATAPVVMPLGQGDVLCLIAMNPTAAPVTLGSLGSVPAKGIGWSCTTNITGGGQTAPSNGSITWP